jgi:hypothetical protein
LYGHRAGTRSLPIGKNNPKRAEYLSGSVEVFLLSQSPRPPGSAGAGSSWPQDAIGEIVVFDDQLAEILDRWRVGRAHTD